MLKSILIIGLICLSTMLCAEDAGVATSEKAKPIKIHEKAPSLSGSTIDGPFDLVSFQKKHPGKHIVIAFSRASW